MGPEQWADIQAKIFPGESGGDYNALFGFQNRTGGRYAGANLQNMTVDQALEFAAPSGDYGQWVKGQIGRVATPMGAYQVVGTTLRDAKNGLGLSGSEKMNMATQDRIGQWIYKTQGPGAWEAWGKGSGGATPQPTIGSQTMAVLGKTLPQQPQRGILATPQERPEPMQKQQPRGLLGSLGLQKMQEGAEGETGQRFYQRDSFKDASAKFGQAFAALGSNPGVQKMANEVAGQRTEAKSRNKTIEYLRANGMDDMANAVEAGRLSGKGVMTALIQKRITGPSATSGIMMGENLVNPKTGEIIRAGTPKGVDYEMRQKLRKEVFGLPAIKDYQTQGVAYAKIVSAGTDPSPAGDLALIFSFMKVMDPSSTVREGEFDQVAKAGKLDERVQSYATQVLNGEELTSEQRADFLQRAEMLYRGSEAQLKDTFAQYGRIAQQQGFDPADVIPQFGFKGSSVAAPDSNVKPKSYPGTQAGWDAMPPADRLNFK